MKIAVMGAGAFGTALAISLSQTGETVGLWARGADHAAEIARTRVNARRLNGIRLAESIVVSAEIDTFDAAEAVLLAIPMQQLADFLSLHAKRLDGRVLIACSKGIDLATGRGPTAVIAEECPAAVPAVLTGPSFAADIARGLPTALTLACRDEARAKQLQGLLSTPALRLYRTPDTIGAELGGALKNVIAIAAGIVSGAGLGDSARAALMTRGFAEMNRFAQAQGARPETLAGLSGLGDLILTCSSELSRNFRYGLSIGRREGFDQDVTVEGAATSKAVSVLAEKHGIDMPVSAKVAEIVDGKVSVDDAVAALLARPLRKE
ncbi:MAG: NAD(P)-dependent glycerol-3-phosphate dehydrogenase [Rhodobacteraceae bacterium]|nr:NAD(P)-dependent glycerol-3-phosphate dehydrogenase [Paracoccaceae bacterium]